MANRSSKLLIIVIYIFFSISKIYSCEIIDYISGIWIDRKNMNYSLSIERLPNDNYFFIYSDYIDEHSFDFSGQAKLIENKLYIKINDDRYFYIFWDSYRDYLYVLWNHDYVGDYDTHLERVSKLYDDEYQIEQEEKYKKHLYESIENMILQEKK